MMMVVMIIMIMMMFRTNPDFSRMFSIKMTMIVMMIIDDDCVYIVDDHDVWVTVRIS